MTLVPLLLILLLATLHFFTKLLKRCCGVSSWLQNKDLIIRLILALLFLIYPGVSNPIPQPSALLPLSALAFFLTLTLI